MTVDMAESIIQAQEFLINLKSMNNIPTAEEFLKDVTKDYNTYLVDGEYVWGPDSERKLIEFAKLHVRACKQAYFDKIKSEGLVTEAGIAYLDNVYPENLIV